MENWLWIATAALIIIDYVLGIVTIIKEKEIIEVLGPVIRERRDLFLVKEAAEASKKSAMLLLFSFTVYLIFLLVAKFGLGYGISKYPFVFGITTLPFALYVKSVENRLKKLQVSADDPSIHEAFRSIIYQWTKKPGLTITVDLPRRKTGMRA